MLMRLRLKSYTLLACSNASISSSHVDRCVVVAFVCCEASKAKSQTPYGTLTKKIKFKHYFVDIDMLISKKRHNKTSYYIFLK